MYGPLFSFKIVGALLTNAPSDSVALSVSSPELKWHMTIPVMPLHHYPGMIRKCHCVGGTFVENLSAGDRVNIVLHGKGSRFEYSREGGIPLTFKGELIALSTL